MNKYTVSIIVLNLIILSNLSYADNNLTPDKEAKLEQLLSIKEEPIMLLPQSEQIQSSSESRTLTLEDINERLEQIEKQNIQEQIELETFEEKVKAYQEKIENLKH
jgi:peptidoglycan hydrolase CwlO-like protein